MPAVGKKETDHPAWPGQQLSLQATGTTFKDWKAQVSKEGEASCHFLWKET